MSNDKPKPESPPLCGHCGMPWMVRPGETFLDELLNTDHAQLRMLAAPKLPLKSSEDLETPVGGEE